VAVPLSAVPELDAADQDASKENYPGRQEDHESINPMQPRKMSVDRDNREHGKDPEIMKVGTLGAVR
jgi:hypothetical protein